MKNIAFYGGGNISQAVIEGLIFSGLSPKNIFFVDRNTKNQNKLKKLKVRSLKNNQKVKIDLFILAVKPKDAIEAYQEIITNFKNPKVACLVAGIKSKKYTNLDKEVEFLRAMPNTSSRFGLGITALYNSSFKKTNLSKVEALLKKIGIVIKVDNESKIDEFTGTIGSGPAYFFYLLKSYEKKLMNICNGDKKIVREVMVNLIKV
jgi:pyrroline-5-carboxylate reductase